MSFRAPVIGGAVALLLGCCGDQVADELSWRAGRATFYGECVLLSSLSERLAPWREGVECTSDRLLAAQQHLEEREGKRGPRAWAAASKPWLRCGHRRYNCRHASGCHASNCPRCLQAPMRGPFTSAAAASATYGPTSHWAGMVRAPALPPRRAHTPSPGGDPHLLTTPTLVACAVAAMSGQTFAYVGSCGRCYEVRAAELHGASELTHRSCVKACRHSTLPLPLPPPPVQQVKCRPANFTDGYGDPLDCMGACFNTNASLIVRITDACPCVYPPNAYSNKRWCCGGESLDKPNPAHSWAGLGWGLTAWKGFAAC